jgi:hypothetical protein
VVLSLFILLYEVIMTVHEYFIVQTVQLYVCCKVDSMMIQKFLQLEAEQNRQMSIFMKK